MQLVVVKRYLAEGSDVVRRSRLVWEPDAPRLGVGGQPRRDLPAEVLDVRSQVASSIVDLPDRFLRTSLPPALLGDLLTVCKHATVF